MNKKVKYLGRRIMKEALRVLILKEDDWWVAQCLEYDIAAQARTLKDVQYEFQRVFLGRVVAAKESGIKPFEGILPAPEVYHKLSLDPDHTFRLELKLTQKLRPNIPVKFTFPKEAILYAA